MRKTKRTSSEKEGDEPRKRISDANASAQLSDDGSSSSEEFEDPYDDVAEEEQVAVDYATLEPGDAEEDIARMVEGDEAELQREEAEERTPEDARVWLPGVDDLADGEELQFESSAYDVMYAMSCEWPCLSLDILEDDLGGGRERFPHTLTFVAGSQADRAGANRLYLIQCSNIARTRFDSDSEGEQDAEEDTTSPDALIEHHALAHPGAVNRVRLMRGARDRRICATLSDAARLHIYDLTPYHQSLTHSLSSPLPTRFAPLHTFAGHTAEGYALDWSAVTPGRLATGDCASHIYIHHATPAGFMSDPIPLSGHAASVEDVQWSPNEPAVLCSASVDQTIRIWDIRTKNRPGLTCKAHSADVNVISWHAKLSYLLVSGADDGTFRSWDLRSFRDGQPAADFTWHRGAITSIEWSPHEESMVTVAGEDRQASTWDLSLEADEEAEREAGVEGLMGREDVRRIPPQLVFVHMAKDELREVRWHPQIPGMMVATAADGFNIYKPYNIHELK